MDLAPDLIDVASMIRDSLDHLASSRGWSREDYRIAARVNVQWGVFQIGLFSREYTEPVDDDGDRHDQIYDAVEAGFGAFPDLMASVFILAHPLSRYEAAIRAPLTDSQVRVDPSFLNPGLREARAVGSP